MKIILNAVLVAALALIVLRGVGGQLGQSGGAAVREQYILAYREELKKAAGDFAIRLESKEFKDSFSAVQAWSKMAAAAGKKASADVADPAVAKVCEAESLEDAVRWAEEFSK